MAKIKTALIKCGSCNQCCRGDAIFIHPELGDEEDDYDTKFYQGRCILKHKENLDCIYLDRKTGCTIYDHRPAICRELDCRTWLKMPKKIKYTFDKDKLKAAKQCEVRMRMLSYKK